MYGTKTVIGKQVGAVTTTGDDAKTFQAAMIEFSKDQPAAKVHYFVVSDCECEQLGFCCSIFWVLLGTVNHICSQSALMSHLGHMLNLVAVGQNDFCEQMWCSKNIYYMGGMCCASARYGSCGLNSWNLL